MTITKTHRTTGSILLVALMLLMAPASVAQWSAQPGETKRNAFGPLRGDKSSECRGACGAGCPNTCAEDVSYECIDSTRLRRVTTYECGTHLGCREHDDCLDACAQTGLAGAECQMKCHQEAVDRFGFDTATSWASGNGPYDGAPITFEYTRSAPDAPDPAFRCPDGARLECAGAAGRCLAADGSAVDPVFDSYPSAGNGAMRISGFRAGRLCGERVCEQTTDIRVTGEDSCDRGSCTRYGMEFDYRNADPSAPLQCSTSTTGGKKDFIGNLLVKGLSAMPERENEPGKEEHGMRVLLDVFKKVVTSADSPEDVRVSIAPLGPTANRSRHTESERRRMPARRRHRAPSTSPPRAATWSCRCTSLPMAPGANR